MMKHKRRGAACVAILSICLLAACSGKKGADPSELGRRPGECDLYVFAAASLENAMEELQVLYGRDHPGVTILLNTDSSGTLKAQIEEGAQCDVFVPASMKQMEALKEGGFVDEADISPLLENQVVLIKGAGSESQVTGFGDITKAANLALAGEDVPVGQYAREIFDSLGITDGVMAMDINEGANVTAVLAAVAERSNEVGVVYATDAKSMGDQVEVIAVAPQGSLKAPVFYPVGLVKDGQASEAQKEAARDFYGYLKSDEAISVFERYGFTAAP